MNTLVKWFAENSIAANILMLIILVGGLTSIDRINKEVNPTTRLDTVRVSISYRGAGPKEVEQQICLRVEEALEGTEGIDRLECIASLGMATANVEAPPDFPIERLLNSVKSRVDAINTFPVDVERPIIEEVVIVKNVASIALYGDLPERQLKEYGESIREELLALTDVPLVNLRGARAYEISIELSEEALRRYNLSFNDIASAINAHSVTLPGGMVRTPTGDIQIQARNQAYDKRDFSFIPVKTGIDGTTVYLYEIAEIIDGFVEDDLITTFNDQPSVLLDIQVTENPNVLKTAAQLENYIKLRRKTLPENLEMALWRDRSKYFLQRLETLVTNGLAGLLLVFALLVIFLRPRVAIWVTVGIAISFLGALFALPAAGISLNIISLFAFVLVLGIVVDDAIIIGENIHRVQEKGLLGLKGAKFGATQMAAPVFFAVMTSIVVFIPMSMIPGRFGSFMSAIAVVPILALVFSLLESLLILPAHLSHMKPERPIAFLAPLDRIRHAAAFGLKYFLIVKYRPFLRRCLGMRTLTIGCFAAVFILCLGLVIGGIVKISLTPSVTFDSIRTTVELPAATPSEEIQKTLEEMRVASDTTLATMKEKYGQNIAKNISLVATGHRIALRIEVVPPDIIDVDTVELARIWRENLGPMPQAESVVASATFGFSDKPIELEISGPELNRLEVAADWVSQRLETYPGTYGVEKSLRSGRPEMEIDPTPEAYNLGLNLRQISNQARQAFFGQEAQRIPRGREDVRVMVRYPKEDRESITTLRDLRIRSAPGVEIPFETVAETRFTPGYANITRVNGRAIISVTSDFDKSSGNTAAEIVEAFLANERQEFNALFPDLNMAIEGEQLENQQLMDAMIQLGALAVLTIFGLLAIQFKSWWQPGLVISAIPFGFAGAVVLHLFKGDALSMVSFFGILAATGVVVNDALVLIDRVNKLQAQGLGLHYALLQSGCDRFRPIMLTTITTFVGLTPIMLETSVQAQFLIPMAMSLAFGVATASVVTLIMVPCAYSLWHQIMGNISDFFERLFSSSTDDKKLV